MNMQTLVNDALESNKRDDRRRFVFYSEGNWETGFRLPATVDYSKFFVIEQGVAAPIDL